jgi:hypothetical protein
MGGVRGRIIGRLNAVTSVSYPLMHPDTRQQLRSLFVEANLGIDQEFEVDTSVWD